MYWWYTTCISSLNVPGITTSSNNLVIGSGVANYILQVGNAGRLRIGSGTTDYTLIGTLDTDNDIPNTKIFLNGNTCNTAGYPGGIQYWSSAGGGYALYTAIGEKMRFNDARTTTINYSIYIDDAYPDLRLGSLNGNNLGIATNASGLLLLLLVIWCLGHLIVSYYNLVEVHMQY